MEKVYIVRVNIEGIDFLYDEISTKYEPLSLYKTIEGAREYKDRLYADFCKEFPEFNHAVTENHAAILEESQSLDRVQGIERVSIIIRISDIEIHD